MTCDACGAPAVLRVNDHPVCAECVDLASEAGETPTVEPIEEECYGLPTEER